MVDRRVGGLDERGPGPGVAACLIVGVVATRLTVGEDDLVIALIRAHPVAATPSVAILGLVRGTLT